MSELPHPGSDNDETSDGRNGLGPALIVVVILLLIATFTPIMDYLVGEGGPNAVARTALPPFSEEGQQPGSGLAPLPSPPRGVRVSEAQYGDGWPFTVPSGTVLCERQAAIFQHDGREYALNTIASQRGYQGPEPILRPDPKNPGWYVSTQSLSELGDEQCQGGS